MGLMALLEVWDRSKFPPESPGGVERPSHRSERGRESLPEVWNGCKGPPEGPEQV